MGGHRPAAARSCGPACREGAPDVQEVGEEGCRRWGQSSAGAWEAGRGRVTLRRWRRRHHGGRKGTVSLRGRDSSPAAGGPSGHTHPHTHKWTTARKEQVEQGQEEVMQGESD